MIKLFVVVGLLATASYGYASSVTLSSSPKPNAVTEPLSFDTYAVNDDLSTYQRDVRVYPDGWIGNYPTYFRGDDGYIYDRQKYLAPNGNLQLTLTSSKAPFYELIFRLRPGANTLVGYATLGAAGQQPRTIDIKLLSAMLNDPRLFLVKQSDLLVALVQSVSKESPLKIEVENDNNRIRLTHVVLKHANQGLEALLGRSYSFSDTVPCKGALSK